MGVVVHIVVLIVVLTATAHCSGEEEFMKEWNEGNEENERDGNDGNDGMDGMGIQPDPDSMSRDELVALAVNDNKTGKYEDMVHHIELAAGKWDQPLNYTERCLLWTAYNKLMLSKWKKIHIRYIC